MMTTSDQRDFWTGFLRQWMLNNAEDPRALVHTKLEARTDGDLRVTVTAKDGGEQAVIVTPWMDQAEQCRVVARALEKLFPKPYVPATVVRRKRFVSRRGPLSCRHWTGAA